jgi:hypothetical protein
MRLEAMMISPRRLRFSQLSALNSQLPHEACSPHSSAGIVANMTASTVAQYLAALPADRRAALSAVPKTINENQTTDDIQADNPILGFERAHLV